MTDHNIVSFDREVNRQCPKNPEHTAVMFSDGSVFCWDCGDKWYNPDELQQPKEIS